MPNYIDKDGLSKVWSRTKSYIGGGYYSKSESDNRYISISPQNGDGPIFHVDIPDYINLNSLYGTEGTNTEVYLQNAIKWCCKWATDNGHNGAMTFTGIATPNSKGWYVLNIYGVSDLTDGLPQYSSGIINNLNVVYEFGTYTFSFICNRIYGADTIDTKLNGKSNADHTHSISEISGGTSSNQYTLTNTNNTIYGSIGDGSMTVVPIINNEVNFGGTDSSDTIYFGYRATGSKPIPTRFVFGRELGTAEIACGSLTSSGAITGSTVYGAVFN